MNKLTVLLLAIFYVVIVSTKNWAQMIDSFSDGNFTSNPAWSGETSSWQIVTSSTLSSGATNSNTLHLNCANQGFCTDYISLQRTEDWGTQQSWGFWLGRYENAGTDAANASFVWLWASEGNFESSSICGYRIRIGGFGIGAQKIYLERVDFGNPSIIITSSSEIPSHMVSDYGLLIRVTRTNESLWSLYCSTIPTQSGEGAIATDIPNVENTPNFLGFIVCPGYTDFSNGHIGFMATHQGLWPHSDGAEFDQLYFSTNANDPTPVELSSFTYSIMDRDIKLMWSTASESDNYGFDVERSNGLAGWNKIGFIAGHGTSTKENSYTYIDENISPGDYYYRLKQIDFDGSTKYSPSINIVINTVKSYCLSHNYPNPFNPTTTIKYSLFDNSKVSLKIFNLVGEEIVTLVDKFQSAGEKSVAWDGRDRSGKLVNSGVYIYSLRIGDVALNRTMIMVK